MAERTCSIDDCDSKHYGRGWCNKHWKRWRYHGDPNWEPPTSPETCSVDECERKFYGRGWCNLHYNRWKKTGTTELVPRKPQFCKIDGCDRELKPPYGWGMCSLHYQRWRIHGDPLYKHPVVYKTAPCSIEGCEKLVIARGWCTAHWTRWKHHGSPTARLRGEVVNGKRICPRCNEDTPLENMGRAYCRPCTNARKAEWIARHPEANLRNYLAWRARRQGAHVELVDRLEVFERDAWICGICKEPVDNTVAWPDPMSPSLDHVVPLARGGDHSYANTQLAHLSCNCRKRDSVPQSQ